MDFDYFEFDGALVAELYEMLDPKLAMLKSHIDPRRPQEFGGFDTMEHICGVAAVAAQRFINATCMAFNVDRKEALLIGPAVGLTTKVAAVYAAANFWKHSDDDPKNLHPGTRRLLEDAGINFEVGDETSYLVGNIFYRCGYSTLKDIILDLRNWTNLVIQKAEQGATPNP